MEYICNVCNLSLNKTQFAISDNKRGSRYECKKCYNERRKTPDYKTKFNKYERERYQTPEGRWTYMLKGVRDRAKQKFIECTITLEELKELYDVQDRRCAKTKREFVFNTVGNGSVNLNAPSLDRIDNSKGYILSNVQLVVYQYNVAKNKGTEQELIQLAKDILNAANPT